MIFTAVDRFSKVAHFVSLPRKVHNYCNYIFCLHGPWYLTWYLTGGAGFPHVWYPRTHPPLPAHNFFLSANGLSSLHCAYAYQLLLFTSAEKEVFYPSGKAFICHCHKTGLQTCSALQHFRPFTMMKESHQSHSNEAEVLQIHLYSTHISQVKGDINP